MENGERNQHEIDINYLVNNVPGGIAVYRLTAPLEILYFNDGVCALSSHTREEYWQIVQTDGMNIVFEEDRPMLMAEIASAVEEKRKIDFTYRIYHKEKGVVWVHLSAVFAREDDGYQIFYAIFMDISDERKTQKILRELAEHDNMTGALNRISFEKKIEAWLLADDSVVAAFLMLDIDNFKQINDFFGHTRGDEVLCMIANLLGEVFGTQNLIARMGGDEFAVFIPRIQSIRELTELIEKFGRLSSVEYDYQDSKIHMSCSIGIALTPKDGTNYTDLYANADKALLYAKNSGKNQYRFLGDVMPPPSALLLRNMEWLLDEGTTGIYICNSETYELLYMNKLARQLAKAQGNSYLGKFCYEELMHRSSPCPFCRMSEMKAETFCTREFKLPGTETRLLMRGKLVNWNGINAHVEFVSIIL